MAPYRTVSLDNSKKYEVRVISQDDRFHRTMANLDSLLKAGRPVDLIIPDYDLSSEEIEEYRRYFCSYAKKIKRNCVYLTVRAYVGEVQ